MLNASNKVTKASSSGTMMRGIEIIVRNRDPRDVWAYTQRNCGVCTWVHAIASTRAVEDALDITIPPNAQLIRNLMSAAWMIPDHVMHFYHLQALDLVNLPNALNANPAATAALQMQISPTRTTNNTAAYFSEVQAKLAAFVTSGQLGIYNGWWSHPGYKLPPEADLLAFAHYLEALAWQREVVRLHAILGGKNPHPMALVGGVPCAISVDANLNDYAGGRTALDKAGLDLIQAKITEIRDFVDQVYLPDTLAIAGFYKDLATLGEGLGNFLSYGEFPKIGGGKLFPAGVILNRNLATVQSVNVKFQSQIQEYVSHSWYDYTAGKNTPLHPFVGETNPNYTGPTPPYAHLDTNASYSWVKSPRWKGKPMEAGPLSFMLVAYASGNAAVKTLVDSSLAQLGLPQSALFSTLGRTLARTLMSKIVADEMQSWYDQLIARIQSGDFNTFNQNKSDPANWPANAKNNVGVSGAGTTEAPRGGLAHWVTIKNSVVDNYQVIAPTTWNGSPRDALGQSGAFEAALVGHQLFNPSQPLEILRHTRH